MSASKKPNGTSDAAPKFSEAEMLRDGFLTTKDHDVKDVVYKLVALSNFLSSTEEDDEAAQKRLETVAAALVQKSLLEHSNETIRVLVALCIASILRIFAPASPYDINDKEIMSKLFKLFMGCFAMLGTPDHTLEVQVRILLERFSAIRAIVLWIEFPDLILLLFKQAFKMMNEHTESVVAVHIAEMLVACIEENEMISEEILELLLFHLLPPQASENEQDDDEEGSKMNDDESEEDEDEEMMDTQEILSSQRQRKKQARVKQQLEFEASKYSRLLAIDVIKTCASKLEPYINSFFSVAFDSLSHAEGHIHDVYERYHELLVELNEINSNLVALTLPRLEEQLTSGELEIRIEAIKTLVNIFVSPNSGNACTEFIPLFNTFIGRFKDTEIGIRLIMTEFAQHYLISFSNPTGVAMVNKGLKDRLLDKEASVRNDAVKRLAAIACDARGIEHLDFELIPILFDRLRDRKDSIRLDAIEAVSNIYVFACDQLLTAYLTESESLSSDAGSVMKSEAGKKFETWSLRFTQYFSSIPSKILTCYLPKEATPKEKSIVERNFYTFFYRDVGKKIQAILAQVQEVNSAISSNTNRSRNSSSGATNNNSHNNSSNKASITPVKEKSIDKPFEGSVAASQLSCVVASFDAIALKAFSKFMDEKYEARNDLYKWIQAKQRDDSTEMSHYSGLLTSRLQGVKIRNLSDILDESLIKEFSVIVSPSSSENKVKLSIDAVCRHISRKSKNKSSPSALAPRLLLDIVHLPFFSASIADHLLNSIRTTFRKKASKKQSSEQELQSLLFGSEALKNDHQIQAMLHILLYCSRCQPAFLLPHLDSLTSLFELDDPKIREIASRISTFINVLPKAKDQSSDNETGKMAKSLQQTALEGNPQMATIAAKSLYADYEPAAGGKPPKEALAFIEKAISVAKSAKFEAAAGYATLTQFIPMISADKCRSLCQHIVSLVLPAAMDVESVDSDDVQDLQDVTQTAIEGINFITNYFKWIVKPVTSDTNSSNQGMTTPTKKSAFGVLAKKTPKKTPGSAVSSPARPYITLNDDQAVLFERVISDLNDVIANSSETLDICHLKAAAAVAFLKLADHRQYEEILPLSVIQNLAKLCRVPTSETIRSAIKATLFPSLTSLRLSSKYMALVGFFREEKHLIQQSIRVRRDYINTKLSTLSSTLNQINASGTKQSVNQAASEAQRTKLLSHMLPEYSLPWYIHIIAHADFFEDDSPQFQTTMMYLDNFIHELHHGANNYEFLFQMLGDIRTVEDAIAPESHAVHIVAELSTMILQEKHAKANLGGKVVHPGKIFLPAKLYKVAMEVDETGEEHPKLVKVQSYLPKEFVKPYGTDHLRLRHQTPTKKPKPKKSSRAETNNDDDNDDDSDSAYENRRSPVKSNRSPVKSNRSPVKTNRSPTKKPAKSTAAKKRKIGEDEEDIFADFGSDSEAMKPVEKTSNTSASKNVSKKRASAQASKVDSEDDEMPLPSPPQRPKRSLPTRRKPEAKSKMEVDNSDSEPSSSEEETPRKRPKRAAARRN